MKTLLKKGFAILLMFSGVMIAILGEGYMTNYHWMERYIAGVVIYLLGARYWYILDVRLSKYGRC